MVNVENVEMWKCDLWNYAPVCRQAGSRFALPSHLFAAIFLDEKTSYKIQYSFNHLYHPVFIYNHHSTDMLLFLKENELCVLCVLCALCGKKRVKMGIMSSFSGMHLRKSVQD